MHWTLNQRNLESLKFKNYMIWEMVWYDFHYNSIIIDNYVRIILELLSMHINESIKPLSGAGGRGVSL